ncbi:MAG TPA: TlpA disulfide reductase family protein [Candidatus Limnocylindria bacterium]|jgi:cytochrome c biogenesis protein CcmG/thiol:disulfide interchange protein DsbE
MRRVARYAAVALIVGLALTLTLAFRRDPHDIKTGTVGKPAPAFALPSLADGTTVSLDQYRGKVVVLNFWASWCVPCKEENPALADVWERYRGTEVVLLGVVFQDSAGAAREYTTHLGNSWPSAIDDNGQMALSYGVFGPPETFFIGPDGIIAGRHIGAIDALTLTNGIETLRAKGGRP